MDFLKAHDKENKSVVLNLGVQVLVTVIRALKNILIADMAFLNEDTLIPTTSNTGLMLVWGTAAGESAWTL